MAKICFLSILHFCLLLRIHCSKLPQFHGLTQPYFTKKTPTVLLSTRTGTSFLLFILVDHY